MWLIGATLLQTEAQPAKTTLFAGGFEVMSAQSAKGDFEPIKEVH
jgi:hypothetical protein